MKKIFNTFLLTAVLLLSATALSAQKYGHTNVGNILVSLPEVKAADATLEKYRAEMMAKGEEMLKGYQTEQAALQKDYDAKILSELQLQERMAKLQRKEQEIRVYEQEMVQKVQLKRQELMVPILKKVEDAVTAVAKSNGYTFIFDTAVFNTILYAQDSDDVSDLVKKQLGL